MDPVFFHDGPPKVATDWKKVATRFTGLLLLVSGLLLAGLTHI